MSKTKLYILSINLLVVLGFFLFQTFRAEDKIRDGETVLLKIRPVDPRSLMQGDYMQLYFSLSDSVKSHNYNDGGDTMRYCVITLDDDHVAQFVKIQSSPDGLMAGERVLRYSIGENKMDVIFGTNTYFFEEGSSDKYRDAQYGMFKMDTKGNCILIGLCGKDKKLIE